MSFRRSSRPSFPQSHAVREACGPVVEALEQRRLLTTLFGGERAHYQDQAGNAIEIALNGSVTAEFVGSNVNDLNQIGLNDLPMTIVSSSNPARVGLRLNGGFAGRYGLQVIGTTPVNDSVNGLGNITGDAVNLSGLASNAAGATFALNVTTRVVDVLIRNPDSTTPPAEDTRVVNIVQLVQINNATGAGTVVFSIEAGLPSAPVVSADEEVLNSAGTALLRASRVSSIQAADFDAAGNLYFVATVEGGPIIDGAVVEGADTDVAVPQLFRVNVTTGVVTAIPGTFNLNIAGTTEEETLEIRSIAFDNNNNLIGYGLVGGSGQFFSIPTNNTNGVGGFTEVRYDRDGDGELDNITDITGIEIVPGDNTFIYAVSLNGETGLPVLLRIRRGTGGAIELGGLEPTTGDSGVPGNDLQGLAWNATLTDPFTGETGVLIATDATTDQLVYIDSRNRVPKSDLWNVYVASGGPSSGIAIAEIPFGSAEDADAVMTPYTGDSGTWRVTNNQSDYDLIDISAPLETGSAVLGTRSIVTVQETVDPFVPFIAAPLIDDIGLVTDNQFGNSLRPGLTTAANAGVDNFFFGGTVTGVVNQDAGMTTFYGGWIITGQTTGQTEFQPDPLITDNFRIRGTLRNLITPATVGSNSVQALDGLSYRSGFDMEVLGNVGWADVGGGFAGTINVQNRGDVPTFAGTRQRELEVRASSSSPGLQFRGNQFLNGTEFHNDSFDTAQRVGVMTSTDLEGQPGVQLLGTLVSSPTELDFRDWYAVTLEAGQTIRVKLTFLGLGTPPQVGLFRPDGVLVATDYSNQLSVTNQEF